MAFTVSDFEDLVGLLAEHPEWRERLRPLVLGEGLISLPSRMDRVEAALEALTAQVRSARADAEAQNQRFEGGIRGLTEAQVETHRQIASLLVVASDHETRMKRMDGRLGNIEGALLETRYINHLHDWFRNWLRRPHRLAVDDLDNLTDALDEGVVSEAEVRAVANADLIVGGKSRAVPDDDLLIVLEASNTINIDDVARADTRAETLRRVGYATQAVVGGYAVSEGATQLAERLGVAIDVHRPPE